MADWWTARHRPSTLDEAWHLVAAYSQSQSYAGEELPAYSLYQWCWACVER